MRMRAALAMMTALALVAVGCGNDDENNELANPASVFCEEQGGRVDMRTDTDGNEYGMCVFDDGTECDEWAFYRGECGPDSS